MDRFKAVVSRVTIADEAAVAALQNALWYESSFRNDLMINEPPTLEDAMHRATRFIRVEEERATMAKKHAPPKVPVSKEKQQNTYYEPRHRYVKERDDKGKKYATYYVNKTQPQQPWSKYHRNDKGKSSQLFWEPSPVRPHTSQCLHLQDFLYHNFVKKTLRHPNDHQRENSYQRNRTEREDGRNKVRPVDTTRRINIDMDLSKRDRND